jgi:hypothetical protein
VAQRPEVAQDAPVGRHLGLAPQALGHVPGQALVSGRLTRSQARQALRRQATVRRPQPDDLS